MVIAQVALLVHAALLGQELVVATLGLADILEIPPLLGVAPALVGDPAVTLAVVDLPALAVPPVGLPAITVAVELAFAAIALAVEVALPAVAVAGLLVALVGDAALHVAAPVGVTALVGRAALGVTTLFGHAAFGVTMLFGHAAFGVTMLFGHPAQFQVPAQPVGTLPLGVAALFLGAALPGIALEPGLVLFPQAFPRRRLAARILRPGLRVAPLAGGFLHLLPAGVGGATLVGLPVTRPGTLLAGAIAGVLALLAAALPRVLALGTAIAIAWMVLGLGRHGEAERQQEGDEEGSSMLGHGGASGGHAHTSP